MLLLCIFRMGLDALVGRLGRCGEIVLAGFYAKRLNFAFAPAFQKEARMRVAAEWQARDLKPHAIVDRDRRARPCWPHFRHQARCKMLKESLPSSAARCSECLKMVLDWSEC